MQQVTRIEEFRSSPTSSYLVSGPFLVWCADPELYGVAMWGSPDEVEVRQILCPLLDVELRAEAVPHASLVDLRHLEGIDPIAFQAFVSHLRSRRQRYSRRLTRQARVRPSGLAGATVAGFDRIVPPVYPISLHETLGEGLAWLGRDDRQDLVHELDEIVARAMEEQPISQRLRTVLVPPLGEVKIESAARRLGLTTRTLQRRLQQEHTTFQAEHAAAQVRAAQTLLRGTDLKLSVIALEAGYSSLAHFSTMFRRKTGEAPSEWRRRSGAPLESSDP